MSWFFMEDSSSLLFELSSDERMTILKNLLKERLKLSHIAKKQDITATEASRHLQRLSDARLIQKDENGFYHLTKYGELNLSLLDSLFFTSGNRQYFLDHDASVLPYQFINRLGELSVSSFQGDFITTFAYVEGMMRQAEEYVYAMEEQFHVNAPPIVAEKMKLGVDIRTILPKTIVPPPGFRPAAGVERRLLPSVKINLFVTDKEAVFGLPNLDGRIDYSVFVSKDPKFRKWCVDLFMHYWDQGKPLLGSIPNLS